MDADPHPALSPRLPISKDGNVGHQCVVVLLFISVHLVYLQFQMFQTL